jgi:hypothetical protein
MFMDHPSIDSARSSVTSLTISFLS